MRLCFDFETSVLDQNGYWAQREAAASKSGGDDFWDSVLPARGLIYALRWIENSGFQYTFYSRLDEAEGMRSFVNCHIFRLMPRSEHFGGFVPMAAPLDTDFLVTADEGLLDMATRRMPVIYTGFNVDSVNSMPFVYAMDSYSQLPLLLSELAVCVA